MEIQTLDDVINQLNNIIDWSIGNNSRLGYFAALYKRMTIAIKNGIAHGVFENGKRMERLDVLFANRYLQAFDAHQNNYPTTSSWKITFDAAHSNNVIVLQHLLLGINTHINLDLGIAASETVAQNEIQSLKNDFDKVNSVIGELVDEVQDELAEIWYPMKFIDRGVGNKDEAVLNFGIDKARKAAWKVATDLSTLNTQQKENYISTLDQNISLIAKLIINPGFRLKLILIIIRWREYGDVKRIIGVLNR